MMILAYEHRCIQDLISCIIQPTDLIQKWVTPFNTFICIHHDHFSILFLTQSNPYFQSSSILIFHYLCLPCTKRKIFIRLLWIDLKHGRLSVLLLLLLLGFLRRTTTRSTWRLLVNVSKSKTQLETDELMMWSFVKHVIFIPDYLRQRRHLSSIWLVKAII